MSLLVLFDLYIITCMGSDYKDVVLIVNLDLFVSFVITLIINYNKSSSYH
jgi:hypothetical protein